MNISFAGCGFIGIYHVGVVSCLADHAPFLLQGKLSGASAGTMAAVGVIGGVPPDVMAGCVMRVASVARERTLGPLDPSCNIAKHLYDELDVILPDDIHLRANGRLHVSVTEVWSRDSNIVNTFTSKEDLLQVIMASSFVPGVSGWLPPVYNGMRVVDGCYSDNRPVLDDHTITVSPFSGNSHICPRDDRFWKHSGKFSRGEETENKENYPRKEIDLSPRNFYLGYRTMRASNPEQLHRLCEQGYEHALTFLLENGLICCDRCKESLTNKNIGDPNRKSCNTCQEKKDQAKYSNLPEGINKVFEDATDSAKNRFSRKVLKVAFFPAMVPIYISGLILNKFLLSLMSSGFRDLFENSKLRHNEIGNCTLERRKTSQDSLTNKKVVDPNRKSCHTCQEKKDQATCSNLSECITKVFKDATDLAKNRFTRKVLKLIYLLAIVTLYISGLVLDNFFPTAMPSCFHDLFENLKLRHNEIRNCTLKHKTAH